MLYITAVRFLAVIAIINVSHALPHHASSGSNSHPPASKISRRETANDYVAYASAAINQMQTWYSAATGLWQNAWWTSANVITMLADFQDYFPSQAKPTTNTVFPTTLAKAPTAAGYAGFLDGFYDDELWWVLAWIKVFDVTGNQMYLDTAATIFEDPKNAWGTTPAECNGGLW